MLRHMHLVISNTLFYLSSMSNFRSLLQCRCQLQLFFLFNFFLKTILQTIVSKSQNSPKYGITQTGRGVEWSCLFSFSENVDGKH